MASWWRDRTRAAAQQPEAGSSLVVVITAFALLFTLLLVTATYVGGSVTRTGDYIDSEKALAAAESGIADFIARASGAADYWQDDDCTNLAMRRPDPDGALPCGWDADTPLGWVAVEDGADPDTGPAFHYELGAWDETSGTEASWLSLRVTGRSGDTYRTLDAELRRDSTEQYLGYQNHWMTSNCPGPSGERQHVYSPQVWPQGSATIVKSAACAGLRTLGGERRMTGAADGRGTFYGWGGAWDGGPWETNPWVERVNGDFFVNDAGFWLGTEQTVPSMIGTWSPVIARYSVKGDLTVANPLCPGNFSAGINHQVVPNGLTSPTCGAYDALALNNSHYAGGTVEVTGETTLSPSKTLPYDTRALADAPGCRYYGPTRIVLHSDGTMTVWSAQSDHAGLTLAVQPPRSATTVDCGTGPELSSAGGATVPVPDGMVVYVADLPAAAATTVVNGALHQGEIGGNSTVGYLPAVGYDPSATLTFDRDGKAAILGDTQTSTAPFYRTEGNLWVEGELSGEVTLATEGTLSMTGDVVMAGGTAAGSTDKLGLIAAELSVVDYRAAFQGSVQQQPDGSITVDLGANRYVYDYRAGTDASGSMGRWPHQYRSGDGGAVQIEAAIQVLEGGLAYQDDQVCSLSLFGHERSLADAWGNRFPGGEGVTYRSDAAGGAGGPEQQVTVPSTLTVEVHGSLAQNYLDYTGFRREVDLSMQISAGSYYTGGGQRTNIAIPAGDCGATVGLTYDARLTDPPPYLLRFTDVGWERGPISEVTTPENLRS